MGYDESLAQTMRAALGQGGGISEKRMMGAICFFLNGNMVGGVDRPKGGTDRFMFRVGKNNEAAQNLPGGAPMIHGGRTMSGFYFVAAGDCDAPLLRRWLDAALDHARRLPPK